METKINPLPYAILLSLISIGIWIFLRKEKTRGNGLFSLKIDFSNLAILITYIIYIVFAVYRKIDIGYGGTDAYAYKNYFYQCDDYDLVTYITSISTFEPGYSLIQWIICNIYPDYRISLLIWHSISFICLVKFMRDSFSGRKNTFLAIVATNLLLIEQFNTLRMTVAISIALNALLPLSKGRWCRALCIVVLASTMHVSALILTPVVAIYLGMRNKAGFSTGKMIAYIIVGYIGAAASIGILSSVITLFGKSIYLEEGAISYGVYLPIAIVLILAIIKYQTIVNMNTVNEILIYALPVGLMCLPLQTSFSIAYRMTLYFLPIIYALIPYLCASYRESNKKMSIASVMVIGVSNLYLIYRIFYLFINGLQDIGQFQLSI